MANVKISEMNEATTLDGTEDFVLVQGGETVRLDADNIFADMQTVKTVKVTLSSAQILTLGTPLAVIVAPGANKFIDVLGVKFNLRGGTTPYDTNTSIQMFLGTPSTVAVTNSISSFFAATDSFAKPALPVLTAVSTIKSNYENQALNVFTSGGNPANGDAALDIYITYQIITL